MRADARRRITLYYQTQVRLQATGSEPRGLGPNSSVENRNSLACLRNAGSYSAESYCKRVPTFLGGTEANSKMVLIQVVPISWRRAVV